MENASKALIMAAEILIGVMVISIGVYLFSTMGQYSANTAQGIEDAQIAQFNTQFLKFYGEIGTGEEGQEVVEPIRCTIHDIVGLANLAKKENEQNGFTAQNGYEDGFDISSNPEDNSNYYVQIELDIPGKREKNLELLSQQELVDLVQEYSIVISQNSTTGNQQADIKYFKCTEVGISNVTRRVDYMKFVEFE